MYARAVDEGAARLRALRQEELEDLGLAALVLGLAVAATQARAELAVPLLLGGLVVGARGVRALWRRWDLVERLSGEVDAYVIPEIRAYAARQATMERRRTFAAFIRGRLQQPGLLCEARLAAVAGELEELAADLEDSRLAFAPAAAVACMRLLSDPVASPLLNPALPPDDLRSRICQIRSGLRAHPPAADPSER